MYNYDQLRSDLFTDAGQRVFLKVRDRVDMLLKQAGAFRTHEAIADCGGDNWLRLACIDRLVELGEIREIPAAPTVLQHRVFVSSS